MDIKQAPTSAASPCPLSPHTPSGSGGDSPLDHPGSIRHDTRRQVSIRMILPGSISGMKPAPDNQRIFRSGSWVQRILAILVMKAMQQGYRRFGRTQCHCAGQAAGCLA